MAITLNGGQFKIGSGPPIKMQGSTHLQIGPVSDPTVVKNGDFSLKVVNGQWLFSLNNPEQFNGAVQIQVVRYRVNHNRKLSKNGYEDFKVHPTYPTFFRESTSTGMYGSESQGVYKLSSFTNVNLTSWVEKIIFENLILGTKLKKPEGSGDNTGKKFLKISFCIKSGNEFFFTLPTITLNLPWLKKQILTSKPTFQQNYNLNNQIIQIES